MGFQKGNPGRQKGVKNKRTREVEDLAEELGVNPFEVICRFAMGDREWLKLEAPITAQQRLEAASTACKYLYSQKRSVEVSNLEDSGFIVKVVDYSKKDK